MRRSSINAVMAAMLVITATAIAGCSGAGTQACGPDGGSVANEWNEAALGAIRADFPAPTVHARNLFHLSAAMWDSYAIFEPGATTYLPSATYDVGDALAESLIDAGRNERRQHQEVAVSFAAHRILTERYRGAIGGDESVATFDDLLVALCLDADLAEDPSGAAAAGVGIATAILADAADDGSLEEDSYVAPFSVANEPLVLAETGTTMVDPNRWQQLLFVEARTQNGQLLLSNVQDYIGPHWGSVRPFALARSEAGLPLDPGPPPLLGGAEDAIFIDAAVDVVRASSALDPADGELLDIGPGAIGNNALGTDDGAGHATNPITGEPYAANSVPAGDYYRVIAEFWADGPDSETPPGHWNALANEATDQMTSLRIGGDGDEVDRLTWDVSLYLALNGALHDSAIAAWGAKATYDYARPISMIRHLGGEGRLPLEDGLVEIITDASSAPGERHELLASQVGKTAIFAWQAEPVFFGEELSPVRWILAEDWMPYQRPTFVTPAFPGYVSGHSTFSRAAAEVLTAISGDPFFPGGLFTHDAPAGSLEFEDGPSQDIQLQWATYYDAADEAGRSRIFGGIHVEVDDTAGRILGAEVGLTAWAKAQEYFSRSR